MCTGLARLVNAIEVDSSCNAIKPADFVAPGVKGNRSHLPTPPPPPPKPRKIPVTERREHNSDFWTPRLYWKCLLHLIL